LTATDETREQKTLIIITSWSSGVVDKRNGTFDFLGFTFFWSKVRKGYWVVKKKTIGKRLNRFMKTIWEWCRDNRHEPLSEQHGDLSLKLHGYYQYYGVRGNFKALEVCRRISFRINLPCSSSCSFSLG
jgi:hypothetical protein